MKILGLERKGKENINTYLSRLSDCFNPYIAKGKYLDNIGRLCGIKRNKVFIFKESNRSFRHRILKEIKRFKNIY